MNATESNHLALPAYATTFHKLPKRSRKVCVSMEPRLLRRLVRGMSSAACIMERDKALANSREAFMRAAQMRAAACKDHGDAGGFNSTPVSGGVCAHWPRETIDAIGDMVTLRQEWCDIARAWHLYAGKRPTTFPSALAFPGGL